MSEEVKVDEAVTEEESLDAVAEEAVAEEVEEEVDED